MAEGKNTKEIKYRTVRCKHCQHWMPVKLLINSECMNCGRNIYAKDK